jgi:hypothetical protein
MTNFCQTFAIFNEEAIKAATTTKGNAKYKAKEGGDWIHSECLDGILVGLRWAGDEIDHVAGVKPDDT